MSINIFFVLILSGLMMIFFFFKPLNIKQQEFIDVPQFELSSFTLYELSSNTLQTLMSGTKTVRYSDRYTVEDMNYTDNSKEYIANMRANDGVYKDSIVSLNGDVVYKREDGLTFTTKKVIYNKETHIAQTDDNFISYLGADVISGMSLKYNNLTKELDATKIAATYQLKGK